MADIKTAFFSYLKNNAVIAAQLGTRIYPGLAPASAGSPYLVYTRTDYHEEAHLTGQSGLFEYDLQCDIWGTSIAHVEDAFAALRGEIDGFRGLWDTIPVRDARITSVIDGFEVPRDGVESGEHRVTVLLNVWAK